MLIVFDIATVNIIILDDSFTVGLFHQCPQELCFNRVNNWIYLLDRKCSSFWKIFYSLVCSLIMFEKYFLRSKISANTHRFWKFWYCNINLFGIDILFISLFLTWAPLFIFPHLSPLIGSCASFVFTYFKPEEYVIWS